MVTSPHRSEANAASRNEGAVSVVACVVGSAVVHEVEECAFGLRAGGAGLRMSAHQPVFRPIAELVAAVLLTNVPHRATADQIGRFDDLGD